MSPHESKTTRALDTFPDFKNQIGFISEVDGCSDDTNLMIPISKQKRV